VAHPVACSGVRQRNFDFLTEQPPVHNGGLELCVLLGVSFLSLFVSWSEFDSFEKSCRDIDSECKDELECECTKKYNSIQKTLKRDTLCWLPRSKSFLVRSMFYFLRTNSFNLDSHSDFLNTSVVSL